VNTNMYIDTLCRLMDAIKKNPEIWRINSWLLLHDNAPAHRSVLVHDFLAENNETTLELSPYSPDLAPADFLPVSSTEISIEKTVFCYAIDIIKNVTEELKRFSQNGFQECFQHFSAAGRSVELHNGTISKEIWLK